MNDIIVVVNLVETIKMNMVIVEFYCGKIKFTKNGLFSGPIKKIDLSEIFESNNLINFEIDKLKRIVLDKNNSQIQKYRHIINKECLFLELIKEYAVKCLFCFSNDYKYHKVNHIVFEYVTERNNLINHTKFVLLKDTLIIYLNKQGTSTNYIPNEIMPSSSLCENDLPKVVKPIPVIYLNIEPHRLIGAIYFRYIDIEISSNSQMEIINDDGNLYFRDLDTEHNKVKLIIDNGWNKSTRNKVFINCLSINNIIDKLIDCGYKVFLENKKELIHSSNIKYQISYNINWFILDAEIIINNRIYNMAELINFKSKKRYLEIEDKVIVLPNIIVKNLHNIYKKNDQLVIENKHFVDVLQISERLGIHVENINRFLKIDDVIINIPDSLKNALRDYQYYGVKWIKCLYNNSFGGCLADDMGLGKTIQVLAFLSEKEILNSDKCNIIVVPKSLIYNWKKEFEKFAPQIKVEIYQGGNRSYIKKCFLTKCTVITTYGTVLNDINDLQQIRVGCLILDEVQYIKNSTSKTYKAISRLNARFKLGLSGTPIENNIGELWAIMNIINDGLFGYKKDFLRRYLQITQVKKIADELKQIISPFLLRRNKENVLKELPSKTEQVIYCGMTEKQKDLYATLHLQIKQQLMRTPNRFVIKDNAMILEGLLYLRQVACHPKLLKRELNINNCFESDKFEIFKLKTEEIMLNGGKLIVFSQFTSMLRIIERWLESRKWKYFYLDGSTTKRQEVVDAFEQADSGIFLISLKAGGVGLNLVSSQYAFIYDPWWNPAVENQAADRIYRLGQKNKVFIYRFVTIGSVEEKIQQLKSIKSSIFENILNGLDNPSEININDLKKLLLY